MHTKEREKARGGSEFICSPISSIIPFFQSQQSWITHLYNDKNSENEIPFLFVHSVKQRGSNIETTFIYNTVTTSTSFKCHYPP